MKNQDKSRSDQKIGIAMGSSFQPTPSLVQWFREASPYIQAHRGKTFIIHLSGEAIRESNLDTLIHDISLLTSLGIKLVLVHGARPQIDENLKESRFDDEGVRITSSRDISRIQEVVGSILIDLQRRLSSSLATAALPRHAPRSVITGNFVRAKPLGVRNGVDYQQTGEVRSLNIQALDSQLKMDSLVLVSPLGYSPSGEVFNLTSQDLAARLAIEIKADKLIYYIHGQGILDAHGKVINEMQPSLMHQLDFTASSPNSGLQKIVSQCGTACLNGVNRCHIISYIDEGALLKELFTRDGTGTQISRHSYEQLRHAGIEDLPGIIALITPLEEAGILVKRSREILETEISQFTVIERDGLIIACAALYNYENKGELACFVIHPDYRNDEKGDLLLRAIQNRARAEGVSELFALTTQSAHWFLERGFRESGTDSLPAQRLKFYDRNRKSKILVKDLKDKN